MEISIDNGRIVDPAFGIDRIDSLHIADARIAAIGEAPPGFEAEQRIDATGLVVCPGLVDLRANLREPGDEHKGTIASETTAALHGGVTTLCYPPETDPIIDSPAVVKLINRRVEVSGRAKVLPLGALTVGLAGEHLAEMYALKEAGCVAVANGSHAITDTQVMRRALEYAASLELPVILHCEDPWLGSGIVHEGCVSTRLGLAGIPAAAETVAVGRDLMLVEQTGVQAHFSRLSTAGAVAMVAEARARGVPVTADVAAHQLYLTELDVGQFNTLCHLRPPLRTQRDRDALRAALADGTLDALCSDHQPHDRDAKLAPFPSSEPGLSGLETLLPLALRLADEGVVDLPGAIAAITSRPASLLGLGVGTLAPGRAADICIFDPTRYWTVSEKSLASQGKNTPFLGWELKGRVAYTLVDGAVVYRADTV